MKDDPQAPLRIVSCLIEMNAFEDQCGVVNASGQASSDDRRYWTWEDWASKAHETLKPDASLTCNCRLSSIGNYPAPALL